MLKLSVDELVKDNENCYSFVVAVAKKARRIAEKANDESIMLDQKPVQIAVKEYMEGKFRVVPYKAPVEEENTDQDSQV